MIVCLKYKTLSSAVVRLVEPDTVRVSFYSARSRYTKNKMVVFSSIKGEFISPATMLYRYSMTRNAVQEGATLYVAPECRISRDIIRKSGYSLTVKPENAEITVIPGRIVPLTELSFDMLAYNAVTQEAVLVTVSEQLDYSTFQNKYEAVRNKLQSLGYSIYQNDIFKNQSCFVYNQIDSYADIFRNMSFDRKYMLETRLPLHNVHTISYDLLDMWRRMPDDSIFCSSVCNSNWQEYPVTLCTIFYDKDRLCGLGKRSDNFNMVLDAIGWKRNAPLCEMLNGRIVEPKDWNFLQGYIMHNLNLPEEGGMLDKNNYTNFHRTESFAEMYRRRYVCAPFKIDKPMLYNNIIALM